MQHNAEAKLDFAYKYPFSSEAKEVIAGLEGKGIDTRQLQVGFSRLENELRSGAALGSRIRGLSSVKREHVAGYVYARMLVSAMDSEYAIGRFAEAEAKAAKEALDLDTNDSILAIARELGLGASMGNGTYSMRVEKYVSVPKKTDSMKLVNQRLTNGIVLLGRKDMLLLMESAIGQEIRGRLPIERLKLPRQVVEMAKALKKYEPGRELKGTGKGTYAWIEKLLATPISDVRHRSVNLIFAPYLMNVRGLDENQAVNIIIDYIDKCKQINPNTKINEPYIRYQCRYAKRKGSRPMSLSRARELLAETLDIS